MDNSVIHRDEYASEEELQCYKTRKSFQRKPTLEQATLEIALINYTLLKELTKSTKTFMVYRFHTNPNYYYLYHTFQE